MKALIVKGLRIDPRKDRLGRHNHPPRRLMHELHGAIFLAEHMPMDEVPKEFWSLDVEGKGGGVRDIAIVSCPCGAMPVVRLLGAPVECECSRVYMFTGRDVQCYGSPKHTTSVPS